MDLRDIISDFKKVLLIFFFQFSRNTYLNILKDLGWTKNHRTYKRYHKGSEHLRYRTLTIYGLKSQRYGMSLMVKSLLVNLDFDLTYINLETAKSSVKS